MKYLKFMRWKGLDSASRNKREIAVMLELGYDVTIVCEDYTRVDGVLANCKIIRYWELANVDPTKKRGKLKIIYDRIKSMKAIADMRADVISCHDIQNLQYIDSVNKLFPWNRRAKLVYDSHEFEYHRNTKRSEKKREKVRKLEKRLMRKCAFTIIADDSYAEGVKQLHGLAEKPVVVRSTPEYWHIDPSVIAQKRAEMLSALNAPEDAFIIMYHGNVTINRGIEQLIQVTAINPGVVGVVLGNAFNQKFMNKILDLAESEHVKHKILFMPAVPLDVLWQYVGAADAGFVVIENACLSYYLTLPNKLLECIQSMTPVIGSDFPEIGKIIKEYQIGLTCDPDDINDISRCVREMRDNRELYAQFKRNLVRAKEELCWERERQVLIDKYAQIMKR